MIWIENQVTPVATLTFVEVEVFTVALLEHLNILIKEFITASFWLVYVSILVKHFKIFFFHTTAIL